MDRFVKELEHARGVIGERAEAVRRVFAARGLPAASLSPIGEVERWIDERLPDLRRRHRMAVGLSHAPSWSPGSLVPYDEEDRRDIGELLPAGRLPTEWLAEVVATQAFLPGEKTRGETLAPYLEALAADPAAARLAIALATRNSPLPKDAAARLLTRPGLGTRDRRPDLVPFLRDLNDRAAVDATSADAFGRMLAAASGAYDEKPMVHHQRPRQQGRSFTGRKDAVLKGARRASSSSPCLAGTISGHIISGSSTARPPVFSVIEMGARNVPTDDDLVPNPKYDDLRAALETVREHVHVLETALDRACAQFGGEPVWVGPVARSFAEELNGRRARMKSAVHHVIAELEAELRTTPAKVSRSAAVSG
ncbi:hypothetical protein ACFYOK_24280 [Microbispora bryophytorum]|uniref:hypothetical protein n=1 Tax=Microbispora bryophytorum TaxID=1460882 RepID=UPI00340226BB